MPRRGLLAIDCLGDSTGSPGRPSWSCRRGLLAIDCLGDACLVQVGHAAHANGSEAFLL